jgi:thymidylate synthase ThyX
VTQNPYLEKSNGRFKITDAGRQYLEGIVTDPTGPVYAFNGTASPVVVAAAMARLSRRAGDMRVTILDEFAAVGEGAAEGLIERVVTSYGDDSVQQLTGLQLVVEGASNLLTKQLEWGRLASYLEQSTRYIFFDQKDPAGRYLWYGPPNLPLDLAQDYARTMDGIFEAYSTIVRQLTDHVREENPRPDLSRDPDGWAGWPGATRAQACDAARPVLPVATKSTVGIFGSAQAIDNLIMFLLSQELEEAQATGRSILTNVRQVAPVFFQRTDRADRGLLSVAYRKETRRTVRALAQTRLDHSHQSDQCSGKVNLIDYWPTDELSLVPEILFEGSGLPLGEIRRQVVNWDRAAQQEVFRAYIGDRLNRRHRPGRALEKAHFEWEIDGKDYGTFRDLQRHRMVDAFEWQHLTPYYGYDLPPSVKQAGLEGAFHGCFEASAKLYQKLFDNGHEEEAQYACLLGHNMRYRFVANLRELFHLIELRTQPAGHPGYRKICNRMFELLSAVYPLSASAMQFVNTGDNLDELTRMASERNTAAKLRKLGVISE